MKAARSTRGWWLGLSLVAALIPALACAAPRAQSRIPESGAAPAVPSRSALTPDSAPAVFPSQEARPVDDGGVARTPLAKSPPPSLPVIRQAYRELTGQLFKEVPPRELLGSAWRAIALEVERLGVRGLDVQRYAVDGSNDIDGFLRQYRLLVEGPADDLDEARLGQAAIRGMTAAVGDSHTRFLSPDQASEQRSASQTGVAPYVGIGIRIDAQGDGITVAEVYSGTPAERAGLRAGDRITRVNGRETEAMAVNEFSAQVRGRSDEIGSEIALTVARLGEEPVELRVNRARIVPPVVTSRMLGDGIGYIKIASFPARSPRIDAAADFDEQLGALVQGGAVALVFDLRGNPGGDPITSVKVASNFVPSGPIFHTIDRQGRTESYEARPRNAVYQGPLVVLIDRSSASGAEVVASALQEYEAGYLIGVRSCGCLSVGRPVQLSDNSGLIVTIERAVTGRQQRSLEGVGIEPNEFVRPRTDVPADAQLDRAVTYLKAIISP